MNSESQYGALLDDLYTSIDDPSRLQSFMAALALACKSHIGILQRQDFRHGTGDLSLAVGMDADMLARYAGFASENIWFHRTHDRITTGSTHFGDDWVSLGELKRTRFHSDLLRQAEVEHSVGICGQLQQGRASFISLCRSQRQGAYTTAERSVLQRLAPHIVNVFALQARIERMLAMTSTRHVGRFMLDHRLHLMASNAAAEAMLGRGWWRVGKGGTLEPTHAATRACWRTLQKKLGDGCLSPDSIPVNDANGILVAFARIHACGTLIPRDGGLPPWVMFVHAIHPDDDGTLASHLTALFSLTSAEAALAVALRRCGDLMEAGKSLSISRAGTRTRLQSIYDKTGTHGQAALVKLLDALAASLD